MISTQFFSSNARTLGALGLGLFASACHGSGASTLPEAHGTVADGPAGASVTVDVSTQLTTEPDAEPPHTQASLVMTGDGGDPMSASIGDFVGNCSPSEPVSTDIVTYRCWWAGGGDNIHVRMDGSDLVVRIEGTDESAPEDPDAGVERLRFHLTPGAAVRGVPHAE